MARAARRAVLVGVVGLTLAGGASVAVASGTPALTADGPVTVAGTEASGVFTVAERTVRQVRYADRGTLRYTFTVANGGRLPVTVTGLAAAQDDPRLFDLVDLSPARIEAGTSATLTLSLEMNGCESLSSRSGSFVSEVAVATRQAGVFEDVVTIALPEEIHTGSPREASCPASTATSRPQG